MRIRSIKPEFWSSQSNGRLSRNARLVFIGLWSVADNFGRFRAEPRVLAGTILPYDRDGLSVVRRALAELESEGKVELYEHERSVFGAIRAFTEHQWMKSRGSPVHPDPRDPKSKPISGQADDRIADGQNRLGEGLRVKDEGSGVKDQGSGPGRDRSKKPKPIQPELPGTPPPPPKPPRAKSAAEEAYELFETCRRYELVDVLGLEFVPDDTPAPAFVNKALGPVLEVTRRYDRGETSGFERLIDLYLEQAWAAEKSPPFPFRSFVGALKDRDSKHEGGAPMKGLMSLFVEQHAWLLDTQPPAPTGEPA